MKRLALDASSREDDGEEDFVQQHLVAMIVLGPRDTKSSNCLNLVEGLRLLKLSG